MVRAMTIHGLIVPLKPPGGGADAFVGRQRNIARRDPERRHRVCRFLCVLRFLCLAEAEFDQSKIEIAGKNARASLRVSGLRDDRTLMGFKFPKRRQRRKLSRTRLSNPIKRSSRCWPICDLSSCRTGLL